MIKKILAAMVMMYAAVSFAAVDVNKATAAELDSIKGIGPAISAKILEEKKKELREMFPQEYPETDTEAFLSSGEMFFSADALKWYLDNAREDYVAQV